MHVGKGRKAGLHVEGGKYRALCVLKTAIWAAVVASFYEFIDLGRN